MCGNLSPAETPLAFLEYRDIAIQRLRVEVRPQYRIEHKLGICQLVQKEIAQAEHIDVSNEIIAFIAEKIESNIRELEGSLTRIIAYASLSGKPITMEVAEEALRNILSIKDPKRITPDLITQAVSDFYGVTPADVRSSKRNREIALPRQIAMYLTRDMTDLSLPRIGDAFGGRDHTTVMHACDKIGQLSKDDQNLKNSLIELRKIIREK